MESLDNKPVIQRNLAEYIHDSASGVAIAVGVDHASQPVAEFGGGRQSNALQDTIGFTFDIYHILGPDATHLKITNIDDRQPKRCRMKPTYAILVSLLPFVVQDNHLAEPIYVVHLGAHLLELLDIRLDVAVIPELDICSGADPRGQKI